MMAKSGHWLALSLLGLAGCSDDVAEVEPPLACAAGGLMVPDGQCIFPGQRPEDCAPGFAHDGDRACLPILPDPCPPGLMAVPGDEACREVAPCGEGPWGDIPLEAGSQHVDAAYAGTDSDGSAERPWQRIQDGVDAAAPGAVVAVAAGNYFEDVTVTGKAVRLWGRCPGLVELVGAGNTPATLQVLSGGSNTEIRGIAITGGALGVGTVEATEVVFANLWIHHTGHIGLDAESPDGSSRVWLRDSLVEGTVRHGLLAIGAELQVDGTVVRDTQVHPTSGGGYGATARLAPGGVSGRLVIERSVFERNASFGAAIEDGTLAIAGSVIRDTGPGPEGYGTGVAAFSETEPAALQLTDCLVERNLVAGVAVRGAALTVTGAAIRDTVAGPDGRGCALYAEPHQSTGATAPVAVTRSSFEGNAGTTVVGKGVALTVDSTVIRDTALAVGSADTGVGQGIIIEAEGSPLVPASLVLARSLVEGNRQAGVFGLSAFVTVTESVIRGTLKADNGIGDGVLLFRRDDLEAMADVTNTRIDENERAAIALFGASLGVGRLRGACNEIDIDGEEYGGQAHAIEDRGDNLCGCPESKDTCVVVTLGLEPIPR